MCEIIIKKSQIKKTILLVDIMFTIFWHLMGYKTAGDVKIGNGTLEFLHL